MRTAAVQAACLICSLHLALGGPAPHNPPDEQSDRPAREPPALHGPLFPGAPWSPPGSPQDSPDAPPRRHVFWDRPHAALPSWFPPQLTWIQKLYYTLISHFGSAAAAGLGYLFGPLGPFVSSFAQPYLSTYASRLTDDVVARSLDNALDLDEATRASPSTADGRSSHPPESREDAAAAAEEPLLEDKRLLSLLRPLEEPRDRRRAGSAGAGLQAQQVPNEIDDVFNDY